MSHFSEAVPMRIALTADLHFGTRPQVDRDATGRMVEHLLLDPPDLFILAGDIGAGDDFEACLELFDRLECQKALVPGNHDVWVRSTDERGNSLTLYDELLPRLAREHGFHYLDHEPLILARSGVAIVGTMNWYDYSWSIERLARLLPDYQERLRTKRFQRGRHNDANFVRWPFDDAGFTQRCVAAFTQHLDEAFQRVPAAIVVTHHPPFHGLNYPRETTDDPDGLLWEAFSGNTAIEEVLRRHEERIPLAFCGHTHRAREGNLGAIQGFNIGGDYHFKRLLTLEWPGRNVSALTFGEE